MTETMRAFGKSLFDEMAKRDAKETGYGCFGCKYENTDNKPCNTCRRSYEDKYEVEE